MLRHRRHDVLVFHVLDDDELNFPFAGTTKFEGMEELPDLLCDPQALRDGYLEALEEYLTKSAAAAAAAASITRWSARATIWTPC